MSETLSLPKAFRIFYGFSPKTLSSAEDFTAPEYLEVTDKALSLLSRRGKNLLLSLPPADLHRASLFGDPLPGVEKHLVVLPASGTPLYYPAGTPLVFTLPSRDSPAVDLSARNLAAAPRRFPFARPARPTPTPAARLAEIHRRLIIRGGSFQEEFPEQLMAAAYIRPDDYVLEIGANIGRNTLVIASLLADSSRLLTLECDPASFATLLLNKNLNRMNFKVENSALSKQRLEQKEWNTRPLLTPTPSPGWKEIRTVDYPQLLAKHNFPPPTAIVADCEGALFHILREEPAILQNLQRLLVENDYPRPEEQAAVEEILRLAGMRPVYAAPIVSNIWGSRPNFYEVWEKIPAAGNSQDQI